MVTLDTNVVLRLLVADDPLQCARAESAWQRGLESGGIFLTMIVLVELAWVLRVTFKCERSVIATKLGHLLDSQGVRVEHEALARSALSAYAGGSADFSDCVLRECAEACNALPVLTFDERFARHTDVQLVPMVQTP